MLADGGTALGAVAFFCWALFLATWILGAAYNARRAPPAVDRRWDFLPGWIVASAALLALTRILPPDVWAWLTFRNFDVAVAGAAVLIASTCLALWARWTLGRMWSSIPTVKEHHELRTDGAYQITRHPIYTGILGMLLGSAMIAGFGPALVAFLVFGGIFLYRIPREEQLMIATFGEQYLRYQQQVPRLIPFPWKRRTKCSSR